MQSNAWEMLINPSCFVIEPNSVMTSGVLNISSRSILWRKRKGAWPSRHEIGSIGLTNGLPTMDTRITQVTAFNSANTLVEAILEKIANAESRKGINRVLKNYQSIKYFRTSLKKRGRRLDLTKTMKNDSQSTREQLWDLSLKARK